MTQLSEFLNWVLYYLYISGSLDNQAAALLLDYVCECSSQPAIKA